MIVFMTWDDVWCWNETNKDWLKDDEADVLDAVAAEDSNPQPPDQLIRDLNVLLWASASFIWRAADWLQDWTQGGTLKGFLLLETAEHLIFWVLRFKTVKCDRNKELQSDPGAQADRGLVSRSEVVGSIPG